MVNKDIECDKTFDFKLKMWHRTAAAVDLFTLAGAWWQRISLLPGLLKPEVLCCCRKPLIFQDMRYERITS
jgi:hypothetical protein